MTENSDTTAARRGASGPGFDLRPTEDYMALLLTCTMPARNRDLILTRVRAHLVDLGISDSERLDEAMGRLENAIPSGPNLEDVVLLEGMPPTPPVDESITWGGNFHAKGFVIDPNTGRADYRRKLADVSVSQGQLLAEVVPGSPGESGQDVFGRFVPPREPRTANIREGKNVRFEPGTRRYFAAESGRIRYVQGMLSVDDVYRVKGDAGLRTGNIDHPGALIVDRDIQTDTVVRAKGDIDVGENIEDAHVESGGNIMVNGGISCKTRGTIKVAGSLHARFIRNADIIAGGDVYVESEINQCMIKTRGCVIARQGRVVGGHITALKGIETQNLGSDGCIPGEFIVGRDYTMEATVKAKKEELESIREVVMKMRNTIAPLRAKRDALTPRMITQFEQLSAELSKREALFKEKDRELQAIFTATRRAAVCHVYVHGTLFPDNLVQLGPQSKKIRETVPGPLRLSLRKGKFGVFKLKGDEGLHNRIKSE